MSDSISGQLNPIFNPSSVAIIGANELVVDMLETTSIAPLFELFQTMDQFRAAKQ